MDEKLLTPNDIHERLIARLAEMRPLLMNSPIIDMAQDTVQRKCPWCKDTGQYEASVVMFRFRQHNPCSCNRPALLAEWEKRLNA